MLTVYDAIRKAKSQKIFVHVHIGNESLDLEVIGAHECSIHRGEVLLMLKGDNEHK